MGSLYFLTIGKSRHDKSEVLKGVFVINGMSRVHVTT